MVFTTPAAIFAAGLASLCALRMAAPLSAAEGALIAGWNGRVARLVGAKVEAGGMAA
jgi:hypothetical protein